MVRYIQPFASLPTLRQFYRSKTECVLKWHKLFLARRKEHANWCELVTGLHTYCDCDYQDQRNKLEQLAWVISLFNQYPEARRS